MSGSLNTGQLPGLIWIQIVCNCYQQQTLAGKDSTLLLVAMEPTIQFDTVTFGWSNVCLEGTQVKISKMGPYA